MNQSLLFSGFLKGLSVGVTSLLSLIIVFSFKNIDPKNEKVYKIGDKGPAGGIVFYDKGSKSNGWRYLEVAPEETEWVGKLWGCHNGTSVETTSEEIGTGKKNTEDIVNHCKEKYRAAWLCDQLVHNGFKDWFLPSKGELNLMYENLKKSNLAGLTPNDYWSSSEGKFNTAWAQYFYNGKQSSVQKDPTYRVRAIRQF
jgi:hypothetical protein